MTVDLNIYKYDNKEEDKVILVYKQVMKVYGSLEIEQVIN
jgi:hypothetical protein